jgi:hypothetical protein
VLEGFDGRSRSWRARRRRPACGECAGAAVPISPRTNDVHRGESAPKDGDEVHRFKTGEAGSSRAERAKALAVL